MGTKGQDVPKAKTARGSLSFINSGCRYHEAGHAYRKLMLRSNKFVILPQAIIEVVDILHGNALVDLLHVLRGHFCETHRHGMFLALCIDCNRCLPVHLSIPSHSS